MAHITQDATNVYIHLTIPKANNLPTRVMNAMIGTYGPIPKDEAGNPVMTDQEFAYQCLRRILVSAVRGYEAQQAATTASFTAQQQADTDTAVID